MVCIIKLYIIADGNSFSVVHAYAQTYNVVNITWTWVTLCWEIADTLDVSCFTIQATSPAKTKPTGQTGQSKNVINGDKSTDKEQSS